MNTILAFPGAVVSIAMVLAGVFAMLTHTSGPGNPPPSAPGMAGLLTLLAQADKVHRRATPYAARASAKVMATKW